MCYKVTIIKYFTQDMLYDGHFTKLNNSKSLSFIQ